MWLQSQGEVCFAWAELSVIRLLWVFCLMLRQWVPSQPKKGGQAGYETKPGTIANQVTQLGHKGRVKFFDSNIWML